MDKSTPWWTIASLMESRGDPREIPARIRSWREAQIPKWSLERLARELQTLRVETGVASYELPKAALLRIEQGKREVSIVEAIGLARVFGKSIAELILPDGAVEESDDWLLFDDATKALTDIRSAAQAYEFLIERLRARAASSPHLQTYVTRMLAAEDERDESQQHLDYQRQQETSRVVLPPYSEWKRDKFLSPQPARVVAEHALGDLELDSRLWYLGWDAGQVRSQLNARLKRIARGKK